MANNILTINEFFDKKRFVIPSYQRGYKWGVPNQDGADAVTILMGNLIDAFTEGKSEYYIQGVTVSEQNGDIILIDGQQRTITFFILMKCLGMETKLPDISYKVREQSQKVLEKIKYKGITELYDFANDNPSEEFQDIYYFKKAIRTIQDKLKEQGQLTDNEKIQDFIKNKVKLFYITVQPEKATKVFTMVNGQKATMKTDELIKADLLSKASRANSNNNVHLEQREDLNYLLQLIKEKVGEEWEINNLRKKYASEWDKWLYWWNRNDVKDFYKSGSNPLGLLLEYYYALNKEKQYSNKGYNYFNFRDAFFNNDKDAKKHFKGIRDLQKRFEDWFYHYKTHNYLGLILKSKISKKDALLYFLRTQESEISFKEYAKWALVDATHLEIISLPEEQDENAGTKEDRAEIAYSLLSQPYVYWDINDDRKRIAALQLLRLNVEKDTELQRKFDFSIWNNCSLEHIHPQSKSWKIDWEDGTSVHCIGNLVLLYGRDNSAFSDKEFEDKKQTFFQLVDKENGENIRKSLHLLHSVSVFANSKWDKNEITDNQKNMLANIRKTYGVLE